MPRTQVVVRGNRFHMWRVPENILNKPLRAANKGWSSSLGAGRKANDLYRDSGLAGSCEYIMNHCIT
jgi:hypothetical protein